MSALPDPSLPWPIVMPAVALIAEAEGLRLKAYRCPAGVWTIGWGETQGVKPGDTCTQEQADRWLLEDLADRTAAVRALCTVVPSPAELGAMVSLAYNIGVDGLRHSTVLRQHNAGNRQAAARAFALWNKARNPATGELAELPGLTARRARETALYLTDDEPEAPARMPQAVEAESSPVRGPMGKAAAVIVGAPVVEMASQASEGFAVLKPAVTAAREFVATTLGVPTQWVVPMLLVIAGVLVLRWRLKQRSEGWA